MRSTERVLGWVNRQRAKLDLPPLATLRPGVPKDPWNCPIAKSICVGAALAIPPSVPARLFIPGRKPTLLPEFVATWATRFDNQQEGEPMPTIDTNIAPHVPLAEQHITVDGVRFRLDTANGPDNLGWCSESPNEGGDAETLADVLLAIGYATPEEIQTADSPDVQDVLDMHRDAMDYAEKRGWQDALGRLRAEAMAATGHEDDDA